MKHLDSIKKNKISKGFTLIEILIATSIFAMLMVVTTSTFSWAVAYNGKLKEMRLTSRNGMKIAEDISTEIRLANGSPKEAKYGSVLYKNYTNQDIRSGEVVLLNCLALSRRKCGLHSNLDIDNLSDSMKSPVYASDASANSLLIYQRSKKRIVLYQSVKTKKSPYKEGTTDDEDLYNYAVYKTVFNNDDWPDNFKLSASSNNWGDPEMLNGENVSIRVDFGGFGPVSKNRLQQPFVGFHLFAASIDYENVQPGFRDSFEIQTTVETREYNKP